MLIWKFALVCTLASWVTSVSAQLRFCNKTERDIQIAVAYSSQTTWYTKGWFTAKPGECANAVGGDLTARYYYYYAKRTDGRVWSDETGITRCVRSVVFDSSSNCGFDDSREVKFKKIDTGDTAKSYTLNLTTPGESFQEARIGEVQKKCIARWEDSHQVHSVETIVEWNYQAVRTRMKKLVHCAELTVTGPIDIEGVAKGYVDHCIDHGLNHQRTRHLLGLIAAIGADIFGAGGAATSAKIADYVSSASNEIVDCLTSSDKITDFVGRKLKEKFNGSIRHESHWEYWNL